MSGKIASVLLLISLALLVACGGPSLVATPSLSLPPDPLAEGDALLSRTDYAGALAAYQRAIEEGVDQAAAEAKRGYILALLYDFDAALAACEHAVELAPDDPDIRSYLAIVQAMAGDDEAALETAKEVVAAHDDRWLSQVALAYANLERGVLDEALAAAESAVALAPDRALAHDLLGKILETMNHLDEAETAYRRAMELQPEFAPWMLDLAQFYVALRQWNEAARLVERALQVGPQECRGYASRATLRLPPLGSTFREMKAAYADVLEAYRTNPLCRAADVPLRKVLWEYTPGSEIEEELEKAVTEHPYDVQAYFALAEVYGTTCRLENVEALFNTLLERQPEEPAAYLTIARYHVDPLPVWGASWLLHGVPVMGTSEAVQHAERALELDPEDVDTLLYLGRVYQHLDRRARAEELFRRATEIDPDRPDAWHYLGLFYGWSRPEEAVQGLERARDLAPWDVDIRLDLCRAYDAADRGHDAIEECQQVISLRPDLSSGCLVLAEMYRSWGHADRIRMLFEEALEHAPEPAEFLRGFGWFHSPRNVHLAVESFRRALEYEPDAPDLHEGLANILARKLVSPEDALAEYQEAFRLKGYTTTLDLVYYLVPVYEDLGWEERVEEAIQASLDNPCRRHHWWESAVLADRLADREERAQAVSLYLEAAEGSTWGPPWYVGRAADLLADQGREEEAIALYREWITRYDDVSLLLGLARFLQRLGRDEEAIATYRQAIQADPSKIEVHTDLAQVYLDADNVHDARKVLDEMISTSPDDPYLWYQAGVLLFDHRAYELARRYLRRAVGLRPEYARFVGKLADAYYYDDLFEEALPLYQEAETLNPQSPWYPAQISACYRRLGDLDRAEEAIMRELAADPSHVDGLRGLADEYAERDRFEDAEALFRRVSEQYPDNPWIGRTWGLFYKDHGQWSLAASHLRQAASKNPDYFGEYGSLGTVCYNAGFYEDAILAFTRAISDTPKSAWLWAWLGASHLNAGETDDAILALEQAVELDEDVGWYYRFLGDAYRDAGEIEEARVAYLRALELDPEDRAARQALDSLP